MLTQHGIDFALPGQDDRHLATRYGADGLSGYDPATGWTHFTPMKWHRYLRPIEGQPLDIEDRLTAARRDYYWDAANGLHVRCDESDLWEILSGQPATWGRESPPVAPKAEWLSVSDIGANFDPPKSASAVLALLRRTGFLERIDGKDVPTQAALGLFEERDIERGTARFPARPGARQRRWAFPVLATLRKHVID